MASKTVVPRIRPLRYQTLRTCFRFKSTSEHKGLFPLELPKNFKFSPSSVTYFTEAPAPDGNRNAGTEKTIPVENPATEEIIQNITCASPQTVDTSINYAHEVFTTGAWSRLPLTTRYQTLINISNLLRESRKSLAARISPSLVSNS